MHTFGVVKGLGIILAPSFYLGGCRKTSICGVALILRHCSVLLLAERMS